MKKTLLIAAAALAAGVISSQAQAVYSQNIVGYVNQPTPAGFSLFSNPLDTQDGTGAVNNNATNVFPNPFNAITQAGPLDGNQLLIWTGTKYNTYVFDSNPSDTPTGFTDTTGTHVLTPPLLGPGVGFYINNTTGASLTNTVVGGVRGVITGGVSNNVVIPTQQFNLLGSATPLGGNILTNLLLSNTFNVGTQSGPLDGCQILIPRYNVAGILIAYTTYVFDSNPSDTPTGFTDTTGSVVLPAPVIPVGGGFFFVNTTGVALNWTQQFSM
jgi:hypothetical protein